MFLIVPAFAAPATPSAFQKTKQDRFLILDVTESSAGAPSVLKKEKSAQNESLHFQPASR